MCKFHKDVAVAVATNPVTGEFNPLFYSITLGAAASIWVDKYMPDMGDLDGYSDYEMSTSVAQQQFLESRLEKDPQKASAGQNERIEFLRRVTKEIVSEMGITLKDLHLPKRPDKSPRFLGMALDNLYEGDPKVGLTLKSDIEKLAHKPLRNVLERMFEIPGYQEAIENSMKSSISNLFITAPTRINKNLLKAYQYLPKGMRTAFGACSIHGGGGAVAHLVVCGGLNTAIGGFAAPLANAAMYTVAPIVASGTTLAVQKYKFKSFNPWEYGFAIAVSLGSAWAASQFLPHEHSTDPELQWFYGASMSERNRVLSEQAIRFEKLSVELQREVLREAEKQKMTKEIFLLALNTCGGDLTPRINAYEKKEQKVSIPHSEIQP